MVKNRRKRVLKKKYFSLKTSLNFDASQMSISKGKFLGGYMIVLSIFLTCILTVLWQYADYCKLNYNISQLQEQKLSLNDTHKLISHEKSSLSSKERIIELAGKQGLVKPGQNVVMVFKNR